MSVVEILTWQNVEAKYATMFEMQYKMHSEKFKKKKISNNWDVDHSHRDSCAVITTVDEWSVACKTRIGGMKEMHFKHTATWSNPKRM